MSLELKRFLLNSYRSCVEGEAADERSNDYFRIDDAKESDENSGFCHICVRVTGLDRFRLHLSNLPRNHEIEELVKSKGGEVRVEDSQCHIRLTLNTSDSDSVLRLSQLIRRIVAQGPIRSDSNQASVWWRTADSLGRFAGLMGQYEKQTAGIEKTRTDGLFAF